MLEIARIAAETDLRPYEVDPSIVLKMLADKGAVLLRGYTTRNLDLLRLIRSFGNRISGDPTKRKPRPWQKSATTSRIAAFGYRAMERLLPDNRFRLAPSAGVGGLNLHNENTFVPDGCPDLLWLYCKAPADAGGESILCDGTDVLAALSERSRGYLEANTIRYQRMLSTRQWTEIYGPCTVADLQVRLSAVDGLGFELSDEGELRYRYDTQQISEQRFRAVPALKSNLLSRQPFGEVNESALEQTADGEPVPVWLVEELLAATRSKQISVPLEAGDILVLDNSRVMHGRNPFSDSNRKVLTLCSWLDDAVFS